jgi:hypothetical protein
LTRPVGQPLLSLGDPSNRQATPVFLGEILPRPSWRAPNLVARATQVQVNVTCGKA